MACILVGGRAGEKRDGGVAILLSMQAFIEQWLVGGWAVSAVSRECGGFAEVQGWNPAFDWLGIVKGRSVSLAHFPQLIAGELVQAQGQPVLTIALPPAAALFLEKVIEAGFFGLYADRIRSSFEAPVI